MELNEEKNLNENNLVRLVFLNLINTVRGNPGNSKERAGLSPLLLQRL